MTNDIRSCTIRNRERFLLHLAILALGMKLATTSWSANNVQTITVHGGKRIDTVVFSAPENPGDSWNWKLEANAASNWAHVSAGQQPRNGAWIIIVEAGVCAGLASFEYEDVTNNSLERRFQYKFLGELKPCGGGGGGPPGPPPPTDWELHVGRTDSEYYVSPSHQNLAWPGSITVHANWTGGIAESYWVITGPETINVPDGVSAEFTATKFGVYRVYGHLKDSTLTDSAIVEILGSRFLVMVNTPAAPSDVNTGQTINSNLKIYQFDDPLNTSGGSSSTNDPPVVSAWVSACVNCGVRHAATTRIYQWGSAFKHKCVAEVTADPKQYEYYDGGPYVASVYTYSSTAEQLAPGRTLEAKITALNAAIAQKHANENILLTQINAAYQVIAEA